MVTLVSPNRRILPPGGNVLLVESVPTEHHAHNAHACLVNPRFAPNANTVVGGYSGAVPNEKITWRKLGVHTPKFMIQSDATLVAPLIFAYILGQ